MDYRKVKVLLKLGHIHWLQTFLEIPYQSCCKANTHCKKNFEHFQIFCTTISFKKVYFSIAYCHLHRDITTWGGAAVKYLNKIKV